MADKPKLNRLLPGRYITDELFQNVPEHELADYQAQVEAYNKTVPRDKRYHSEYIPEDLRTARRALSDLVGTVASENMYDFLPPGTIFDFRGAGGNHGRVDHDQPARVQIETGRGSTLLHEAAHSDSLRNAPMQLYFMGHRMYPGYSGVVGKTKLPESKNYKEADYGGYEEDAARLRAAYGMAPQGTKFNEFFAGTFPGDYTTEFKDKVPGKKELVSRGNRVKSEAEHLKMLEHTLFPKKRFLEENTNSKTLKELLKEYKDALVAPVGKWYEEALSR